MKPQKLNKKELQHLHCSKTVQIGKYSTNRKGGYTKKLESKEREASK